MKNNIVNMYAGGGGASLNRLYNGGNIIVINNNWRGRGDNATVTDRKH